MTLDLTEDETVALLRELDGIIASDRYFLSPRVQTLKAIRTKLRPEPDGIDRRRRLSRVSRRRSGEGGPLVEYRSN